jgi:glycosyltransferase involved in cell wall biosynthesis
LNLLIVDQFSEPGGAQLCIRSLLPEMRQRGWQVETFVPAAVAQYANGRKTAADMLRYALDMRRATAAIRQIVQQRSVQRRSIDLILVNGPRVLPAAAGAGPPIVFYSHSVLWKWYARMLARRAFRRTWATVIAASHYVARTLYGLVSDARIQVIYSGVADLGAAPARQNDLLRVGLIGRIAPEKGHLDFVAAARRCRNARFFVYGAARFASSSYEREVRASAEGAPVEFRGWVEDPAEALRELDIVAAPSMQHDAAPLVVLEALSAGKPIVAYRSGGIPELIKHDKTGILTDARTPESLADSISALLLRPDRRVELAHNARRAWQERFRLDRYQREICEALERAARNADPNSART